LEQTCHVPVEVGFILVEPEVCVIIVDREVASLKGECEYSSESCEYKESGERDVLLSFCYFNVVSM
jgi:hypothetical protein